MCCVAVTADKCTDADLDRPDATTIYRSPSNATEAVLLRPDCTFERVPISRDQEKLTDASRTLNFTGMGAEQVVSYPSTVNTFVLDRNAVHEANFSTAMDLRFLILRRSQLTNVDKFIMPPSLFTLDLRGNAMHSLNGSKLPDTTYSIIISENKLQNLDNFIFPRSLRQL
ncbi:TPA: hypothetical protein N0F65_010040 [Lagenidium giganteum]|uniref:Uncharacterized protein n=1 Tax=Lagenidium giganteum TaxID=4803 RepID=A0AAV2ZHW3_9STRA|nr:TPA: hypothetical protein N0F65_010040 [Lagenidium giganteum]